MSFTQMLFAADFCPPFDPGLKFSIKNFSTSWTSIWKLAKIFTMKFDVKVAKSSHKISLKIFQDRKIKFLGIKCFKIKIQDLIC